MSQAGAPSQSSLSSVINIRALGNSGWVGVESDHKLARLHERFFERPVSKPTNVKISKEDDITEDCFALELGEKTFEPNKIWVRAEYIRIFNYIVEYYKKTTESEGKAPSFVVTGQPGIGKSVFLYYVLYRCLAEKRPVIWLYLNELFIFVDEGVYSMCNIDHVIFSPEFKIKVWTLVDSDENRHGIPERLIPRNTPLSVIYATSPAKERWSRLHKVTSETVIVMNPWSRGEIHQAAYLFSTKDSITVDAAFDHLGPTPRLCLETAFDHQRLERYKRDRSTTLEEMTLERLRTVIIKVKNLNMDGAAHKVCLIKRAPDAEKTGDWSDCWLQPITDDMQSQLAIRMRNLDICQHVEMFLSFSRVPSLKGMAGPLFEGLGHAQFQRHISIYYSQMVRLTDENSNAKNQPQYHSSHIPLPNQELEAKRHDALEFNLDVRPFDVREYDDKDLPNFDPEEGVYYIPAKENEVALDTFICSNGRMHMFQFTVSDTHDINPRLVSRSLTCTKFPPLNEWHFIFVIPNYVDIFKSPYPSTPELQELKLFSCQITMDEDQEMQALPPESSKGKNTAI